MLFGRPSWFKDLMRLIYWINGNLKRHGAIKCLQRISRPVSAYFFYISTRNTLLVLTLQQPALFVLSRSINLIEVWPR